jgi:DNA replication protein DnaC
MLYQQTIESLHKLKLTGMINALKEQQQNRQFKEISFEDRFGMLVDRELNEQENRRLELRLRKAKLRQTAVIEDVDFRAARGLSKSLMLGLATCDWLREHQNVLIIGPTGVGKSFLACALAHKACREGFTVQYHRASRLFNELAVSRADGRYLRLLKSLARVDLIILDDWGLEILNKEQRGDMLEIFEDRHNRKSLIITSQIPFENWHSLIGEATHADAILDRVVHNAHIINLEGGSMRKKISKNSKNNSGS